METNNGTEAQNKALKYKYLPHKAISLSHVVTIIIEQFLPEQHRKYLFLNFQMDPTYRAYTTHVPSYLQGRPRNVILHCLAREEKARKTFSPNDITDTDNENGIFLVHGKSGYTHTVDFGSQTGKPSCTCQDWTRNNIPCKHFFLIFMTKGGWGWSSLPQSYLKSPYLSCDSVNLVNSQVPTENAPPPSHSQPEDSVELFPDDLYEFSDKLPTKVYTYRKIHVHACTMYMHVHVQVSACILRSMCTYILMLQKLCYTPRHHLSKLFSSKYVFH